MKTKIFIKGGNVMELNGLTSIEKTSTTIKWTNGGNSEQLITVSYDEIQAIFITKSWWEVLQLYLPWPIGYAWPSKADDF